MDVDPRWLRIRFLVWAGRQGGAPLGAQGAHAHPFQGEVDVRVRVHGCLFRDVVGRRYSCDVLEDRYGFVVNDKERGTHLDRAALPGVDGRLAFVTEEIVFTIGELCAENFGVPFQNLGSIIDRSRIFA